MARMKTAHMTPREKWKALVPGRLQNALDKIRTFSRLSNASEYEYHEREVEQCFEALQNELTIARESFSRGEVTSAGSIIEFEDDEDTEEDDEDTAEAKEDETNLEDELEDLE